ncbi:hypothetical protein PIB30_021140 [Stylosanthes scabra]|uniref:Uncharacterized protein n=1 Tax=Stylosanthes scabra TaxID=79078 RepID=A0ABU6R925_9FABA|nr:hypothetical protein [Stylosanthes scabra]
MPLPTSAHVSTPPASPASIENHDHPSAREMEVGFFAAEAVILEGIFRFGASMMDIIMMVNNDKLLTNKSGNDTWQKKFEKVKDMIWDVGALGTFKESLLKKKENKRNQHWSTKYNADQFFQHDLCSLNWEYLELENSKSSDSNCIGKLTSGASIWYINVYG